MFAGGVRRARLGDERVARALGPVNHWPSSQMIDSGAPVSRAEGGVSRDEGWREDTDRHTDTETDRHTD